MGTFFLSATFSSRCWQMNQPISIRLYDRTDVSKPCLECTVLPNPLALPEIAPGRISHSWWDIDSIDEDALVIALDKSLSAGDTVYLWDHSNTATLSMRQLLKRKTHLTELSSVNLRFINLYNVYTSAYCLKSDLFSWPSDSSGLTLSPKVGAFLADNKVETSMSPGINLDKLLSLFEEKAEKLLAFHCKESDLLSVLKNLSFSAGNVLADNPQPVVFPTTDSNGLCAIIIGYPIGMDVDGGDVFLLDINRDYSSISAASSDEICRQVTESLAGQQHEMAVFRINTSSSPAIYPMSVLNQDIAGRFSLKYQKVMDNISLLSSNSSFSSKLKDAAFTSDEAVDLHHAAAALPHVSHSEDMSIEDLMRSDSLVDRWVSIIMHPSRELNTDEQEDARQLIRALYRTPLPNGISWRDFTASLNGIDRQSAEDLHSPYNSYLTKLSHHEH